MYTDIFYCRYNRNKDYKRKIMNNERASFI